jgi:hypothetical protein
MGSDEPWEKMVTLPIRRLPCMNWASTSRESLNWDHTANLPSHQPRLWGSVARIRPQVLVKGSSLPLG